MEEQKNNYQKPDGNRLLKLTNNTVLSIHNTMYSNLYNMKSLLRFLSITVLILFSVYSTTAQTTFTVTNTGDNGGVNPAIGAGTGTLRQAIVDANGTAGADNIFFNIPAGMLTNNVAVINLIDLLPTIAEAEFSFSEFLISNSKISDEDKKNRLKA